MATPRRPAAEPPAGAEPAVRVLKKYPNRRLYDTQNSSYITLADVKQMVLAGEHFEVRDAKTAEDLTRSILLQIILEEETGGMPMFSAETLAQIIRFYGHAMQGAMGTMLERNMALFADLQKQFLTQQPSAVQTLMDGYAEQGRAMFEQMQKAGAFFPGMGGFPPPKK
jgi:polyhydroxyalkanoate synthesis repressor PhaR